MNRSFVASLIVAAMLAGCSSSGQTTPNAAASPSAAASPTAPSPSPTLLASGTFNAKGAAVELNATGGGSGVTGVMTVDDDGQRFTVNLECARRADGGLLMIGGDVTDSTHSFAPEGTRVLIIFRRGSPVQAAFHFETDPPAASCAAFLEDAIDAGAEDGLEPIEGNVELSQ